MFLRCGRLAEIVNPSGPAITGNRRDDKGGVKNDPLKGRTRHLHGQDLLIRNPTIPIVVGSSRGFLLRLTRPTPPLFYLPVLTVSLCAPQPLLRPALSPIRTRGHRAWAIRPRLSSRRAVAPLESNRSHSGPCWGLEDVPAPFLSSDFPRGNFD